MESLDPACTPLKQQYDSCFNLWFEGYLQPLLDSKRQGSSQSSSLAVNRHQADSSASIVEDRQVPVRHTRVPPVTSWAKAFPDRSNSARATSSIVSSTIELDDVPVGVDSVSRLEPFVTEGKTRAQIKAEEYEGACGADWRKYQGCLKKAIDQNTGLVSLLEQAKTEHPLGAQEGLRGTAWDRSQEITDE